MQDFVAGTADFAGTDVPLSDKSSIDKATARCHGNPVWHLPLVFVPIAIAYRLHGVSDITLTGEVAAKIFSGLITRWNDPAIKTLNPSIALPNKPITVFFRQDQSVATGTFQRYLEASSNGVWTHGVGTVFTGGVGEGKGGDWNVWSAMSQVDGGITYAEWRSGELSGLTLARIDGGVGPTELTSYNVANTIRNLKFGGSGNDLALEDPIYARRIQWAYPLAQTVYEVVCSRGYDLDTAKAVKAFLTTAAVNNSNELLPVEHVTRLLNTINAIS